MSSQKFRFASAMAGTLLAATSLGAYSIAADSVETKFVGKGMTAKMGGYRPNRVELTEELDLVKKAPEGLENPEYGVIKIGEQSFAVILVTPEEGEPSFWLDSNSDGDLTNDPKAEWTTVTQGKSTMYNGSGTVILPDGQEAAINFYRFDPKDPARKALSKSILFYEDFGTELKLELDGKSFESAFQGSLKKGDRLGIDRNGDGKVSRNFESIAIGAPFNFTGTTYELNATGGKLSLDKSKEDLPVAELPPDLRLGKTALSFSASTLDGKTVNFPKDYAGKVVMLDFWATWCGPCIGEIPHMKTAYEKWHGEGFEILGVSFDQPDKEEDLKKFLEENKLPWNQIYEGKGWETQIGRQHDVSGIPFVLLVDGDTGEILGTARELRGEKLTDYIEEKLSAKKGETKKTDL